MALLDTIFKRWPLVALVASAAMLAIAHGFQTFRHLAPCHLCLKEREAYWAAMAVAAVGVAAGFTAARPSATRIASLVLALVFAYGTYLAAFHAGAEWKWWPAPQGCSSAGPVSLAELKALMGGGGAKPPVCDQAPWVFLGLSMAGWNCLISAALAGLSLTSAARKEPAR